MPSNIRFVLSSASKLFSRSAVEATNGSFSLISASSIRKFSVTASRNMHFVQFQLKSRGPQHLGAQLEPNGDIFDISAVDSSIPNSLVECLATGESVIEKTKRIIAAGKSVVSVNDVNLLAPISKPDKVVCIARNYTGHCQEQNLPAPTEPMFFSKFSSCLIGPYDEIILPEISKRVDWEVELAVVMGKKAKCIRPDQVESYIFGYTIAQDISARDWQKERNGGQFLLGKSMDTFCPIGPSVVTRENIIDVNNLNVKTILNGDVKQNGNTSEMIFKIDFMVSYLSQIFTLLPGDVILTGTPAGVGVHRNPPLFLKAGDVLESEIECIGRMSNKVV
ncbi:fumarylacetoacetate hydrolase domain-containing protein 2A isoform X2 [Photinus pyralis]|uniref:fumarylacetoacetate hydrolase domain-containing protein 2A isoform X2 n=1 Tax=Photinus pyralis TaxID=7054 RepID=UPI0012670A1F|nr:fumarylacetoacetate hydrolase domain-containing protein 2A isoform X2 [Photinus pyralis]